MQAPLPAASMETSKTAVNGRESTGPLQEDGSHIEHAADLPYVDSRCELSHESVDAINRRYMPAKGLRIHSSL